LESRWHLCATSLRLGAGGGDGGRGGGLRGEVRNEPMHPEDGRAARWRRGGVGGPRALGCRRAFGWRWEGDTHAEVPLRGGSAQRTHAPRGRGAVRLAARRCWRPPCTWVPPAFGWAQRLRGRAKRRPAVARVRKRSSAVWERAGGRDPHPRRFAPRPWSALRGPSP
jgi:hypothetical protein